VVTRPCEIRQSLSAGPRRHLRQKPKSRIKRKGGYTRPVTKESDCDATARPFVRTQLQQGSDRELDMRCFLLVAVFVAASFGSIAAADKTLLEGVINLNTASPDELRLIPGVGPSRVRNIMAYRKLHPFRAVDELARIKGIGRKTIRKWRQHLAVSGPSTAQRVVRPALPFVGPPAGPAPPTQAKSQPVAVPVRWVRPGIRRGEPAHAAHVRAPANLCLPGP
jgi:competence protein ComEA